MNMINVNRKNSISPAYAWCSNVRHFHPLQLITIERWQTKIPFYTLQRYKSKRKWRARPQLERRTSTLISSQAGLAVQLHVASMVTWQHMLHKVVHKGSCWKSYLELRNGCLYRDQCVNAELQVRHLVAPSLGSTSRRWKRADKKHFQKITHQPKAVRWNSFSRRVKVREKHKWTICSKKKKPMKTNPWKILIRINPKARFTIYAGSTRELVRVRAC